MKTKQPPATQFESIDVTQLGTVIGGCACGCGQPGCNCDGSCNAAQRRPAGWGR